MAAPFTLSSAKKGSNPSPAKAFAFVSNSRPFLAFSNASFVQFDSSNQEVFFFRPTFLPPLQLGLSPLRGQKGGNLPFDCLSRAWRKGRLLVCSEITSVRFGHTCSIFVGTLFENLTIEFRFSQRSAGISHWINSI